MEFRQLRTFRTVATVLNFNRAAEQLHYAQSTVSAQIQALENDLGVQLFDRLGKRVLLTEAGERLLQYAEKMLDLADETVAELTGAQELEGSLTIRVPETFGVHLLPPAIKAFQFRFPKVRLRFTTCAHETLPKDLRLGITDLAFLLAESIQAADLRVEALGVEKLVLVSNPNHPLAGQSVVKTRDLADQTILLSKVDCGYRKVFERILAEERVRSFTVLEFSSVAAIKQCVTEGVGLTILPEIAVAKEMALGRLTDLQWIEGELEVALLMLWHKDKWLSPALCAFMDAVREIMDARSQISEQPAT